MVDADTDAQNAHPAMRVAVIALVAVVLLAVGTVGSRMFVGARLPTARWKARNTEKTPFTTVTDWSRLESDFPMPPSGRVVYPIKQADSPNSIMVMCRSDSMSSGHVAEFYTQAMAGRGWKEARAVENELNRHAEGIMLFFTRKGRECLIHVEGTGTGARWVVMLKRRIMGGGSV